MIGKYRDARQAIRQVDVDSRSSGTISHYENTSGRERNTTKKNGEIGDLRANKAPQNSERALGHNTLRHLVLRTSWRALGRDMRRAPANHRDDRGIRLAVPNKSPLLSLQLQSKSSGM